jgi:hypothetical protein
MLVLQALLLQPATHFSTHACNAIESSLQLHGADACVHTSCSFLTSFSVKMHASRAAFVCVCHGTPQAEVKRRTDSDRQLQTHFDSEIKSLQVRRVLVC